MNFNLWYVDCFIDLADLSRIVYCPPQMLFRTGRRVIRAACSTFAAVEGALLLLDTAVARTPASTEASSGRQQSRALQAAPPQDTLPKCAPPRPGFRSPQPARRSYACSRARILALVVPHRALPVPLEGV